MSPCLFACARCEAEIWFIVLFHAVFLVYFSPSLYRPFLRVLVSSPIFSPLTTKFSNFTDNTNKISRAKLKKCFSLICWCCIYERRWWATVSGRERSVVVPCFVMRRAILSSASDLKVCVDLKKSQSRVHFSRGGYIKHVGNHIEIGLIIPPRATNIMSISIEKRSNLILIGIKSLFI